MAKLECVQHTLYKHVLNMSVASGGGRGCPRRSRRITGWRSYGARVITFFVIMLICEYMQCIISNLMGSSFRRPGESPKGIRC